MVERHQLLSPLSHPVPGVVYSFILVTSSHCCMTLPFLPHSVTHSYKPLFPPHTHPSILFLVTTLSFPLSFSFPRNNKRSPPPCFSERPSVCNTWHGVLHLFGHLPLPLTLHALRATQEETEGQEGGARPYPGQHVRPVVLNAGGVLQNLTGTAQHTQTTMK